MADLLDIAPSTAVDVVVIGGGETIDVRRLNVNDIAALAARFPSLLAILAGGGGNSTALIGSSGQAVAAVIAAGCDHLGDERAEALAASFAIEDQIKLINAILRLTFPNGVGSVMQAVENLASLLGGAEPKVVKMRLKPSPSPSPPLSEAVSHRNTS